MADEPRGSQYAHWLAIQEVIRESREQIERIQKTINALIEEARQFKPRPCRMCHGHKGIVDIDAVTLHRRVIPCTHCDEYGDEPEGSSTR
jgi:hypothetical protein